MKTTLMTVMGDNIEFCVMWQEHWFYLPREIIEIVSYVEWDREHMISSVANHKSRFSRWLWCAKKCSWALDFMQSCKQGKADCWRQVGGTILASVPLLLLLCPKIGLGMGVCLIRCNFLILHLNQLTNLSEFNHLFSVPWLSFSVRKYKIGQIFLVD